MTQAHAATADSKAGSVSTAGSALNVRSGASTGTSVIGTLKNGSYVTLISRHGDWWYVEFGADRYGYCHADYIDVLAGNAANVTTRSGNLNVRSGPGTSYSKIGSLTSGETVMILSSSGNWHRIVYDGTKTGYASAQYLSGSSSGISLSVPYYRQNDSRWANVKIGSSGKTISQIGCATTGIAMIESYRTGSSLTPDAMSRKLRYTSSGNVYWPSDYTPYTGTSGYLERIYNQLQAGKPVLFGGKTSSGKQHWVVITGYTGGNALNPSGFTIQDPGTASRTNLQHFLNTYPVIYKYFCYN